MRRDFSVYLDFVRVVAAFAVVFGHAFGIFKTPFKYVAGHGPMAVAVFFVLSGFLMSYAVASGKKGVRGYFIARASRVYSVAVPAVFVAGLADWIGYQFDPELYLSRNWINFDVSFLDVLTSLVFGGELFGRHLVLGSNEPFWSLGFEVFYYFIFGVLVFLPVAIWIRMAASFLLLLVAGMKLLLFFPIWLSGVFWHRTLVRGRWSLFWMAMPLPLLAALFFAMPILYVFAWRNIAPMVNPMFWNITWSAQSAATVLYFNLIGVLFGVHLMALHFLCARVPSITLMLKTIARPTQWIAGASFTLYLTHQPLLLMLAAVLPGDRYGFVHAYACLASMLCIVLVIAHFTERRKAGWRAMFERFWPASSNSA